MGNVFNNFSDTPVDVVAIGGGNGLATLLSGMKEFVGSADEFAPVKIKNLSAVVAVSDDGGSSGRLRDEFNMPPPGDIRNCMVALSEDSQLLSKLFQHRFTGNGGLGGHSFGNLFLAALSEITGDFAEAVRLSSEVLASKGHIYPVTEADVRIAARLVDGTVIRGETNVGKANGRVDRLFLEPEDCNPMPAVIERIEEADIITVGPGSLFTSLIPPLLVNGVAEAIARSSAVKIFICNLMTQPGETSGLSLGGHLDMIRRHAPALGFDHIIVNSEHITTEQQEKYKSEGSEQLGITGKLNGEAGGARIFSANLLDKHEKVRHDPRKLALAALECFQISHASQNSPQTV